MNSILITLSIISAGEYEYSLVRQATIKNRLPSCAKNWTNMNIPVKRAPNLQRWVKSVTAVLLNTEKDLFHRKGPIIPISIKKIAFGNKEHTTD